MDTGDQSSTALPPDAPEGPKDTKKPRDTKKPKDTKTASPRGRRSKLSEAVSTLVTAVTEGGGPSLA